MLRQMFLIGLAVVSSIAAASAQVNNAGGGGGFAGGVGGLGNAGSFATGPGFSNGFQNSNNFGLNAAPRGNYGAVSPSMQSIPGVSNYAGVGTGLSSASGAGMGLMPGALVPGASRGLFSGAAPSGSALYGNDVGAVAGNTGYTDFGNALTASALGLGYGYGGPGYGALGYGGLGYGGLGYGGFGYGGFGYGGFGYGGYPGYGPFNYGLGLGPLGQASFGPMGFTYPGMVPGAFLPGMGYMSPIDVANVAALNAGQTMQRTAKPAIATSMADGAKSKADAAGVGQASVANRSDDSAPNVRRSMFSDNGPFSTANATRIQNRLHNIKSPNFKNVKVLIANRIASLSGTVDSVDDEQLAVRMVGLEPGVVEVKSELVVNGATAK